MHKLDVIKGIDTALEVAETNTLYEMGFRNGLRYAKSLIDNLEPEFETPGDELIFSYNKEDNVQVEELNNEWKQRIKKSAI